MNARTSMWVACAIAVVGAIGTVVVLAVDNGRAQTVLSFILQLVKMILDCFSPVPVKSLVALMPLSILLTKRASDSKSNDVNLFDLRVVNMLFVSKFFVSCISTSPDGFVVDWNRALPALKLIRLEVSASNKYSRSFVNLIGYHRLKAYRKSAEIAQIISEAALIRSNGLAIVADDVAVSQIVG